PIRLPFDARAEEVNAATLVRRLAGRLDRLVLEQPEGLHRPLELVGRLGELVGGRRDLFGRRGLLLARGGDLLGGREQRLGPSRAEIAACEASLRTSSATTAKPRPCGPARAASMAAFSASMFVWVATAFACATNFWMSCAALVSASASAAPFSTSSASLASCAVLWSSTSLLRRATPLSAVLRRAASSEPLARMLVIWRIRPASSAADRTSWAWSAAFRDRSWAVEVSCCVLALIS